MNILFLCNKAPYPPKDGGSIATFGMIKAFAELGHEVSVLAMNTQKHHIENQGISENIKKLIQLTLVEVPAPITIHGLIKNLLFSTLPYNAERFINENFKQALKNQLQHSNFDIVQLEGLYLVPYIDVIRKYSKAKIAYRSHNIEHEIWKRSLKQASAIKKVYLKILTKRILKFEHEALNQYDVLVPITERDGHLLNSMGNIKPMLSIPAGINKIEVSPTNNPLENNLFFIGALDWPPNQEGLIWFFDNCWDDILKIRPKTRLKIAGRNAPIWLINKIRKQNVQYLGEIENAPQYIRSNGIMIAPLLSGSGMRIKIIEGMQHGKTIITTTVGCEGIPITNKEHLFFTDDPKQFATFAIELLADEHRTKKTGQNARNFVENHYNNKILIQQLVKFYKQHLE